VARCQYCGANSPLIAQALGFCAQCIRAHFAEIEADITAVHRSVRQHFGLPQPPLVAAHGRPCRMCVNECQIAPQGVGACGLHGNDGGRASGVTADWGKLSYYYDSLPTNCVADWVCPAGGVGYPRYSYRPGPEYGYKNLAVFYHGCTFNCLFCQNWHHRQGARRPEYVSATELADAADARTACICFFGGDPTPQLPHSFRAALQARAQNRGRILRICWETNGSMHPALCTGMAELALESGGCIKFDLKAWSEPLHRALCGAPNHRTQENFARLAARIPERPEPPLLVASTLLVPGYIDEAEIGALARFIARLNPDIPYALLAFYPHFFLSDLARTSRRHAEACLAAAQAAGLRRVRLGNVHLLSEAY